MTNQPLEATQKELTVTHVANNYIIRYDTSLTTILAICFHGWNKYTVTTQGTRMREH